MNWRALSQLGVTGAVGLALVVASVLAYLLVILPGAREQRRLEQESEALRIRAESSLGAHSADTAPAAQLEAFYEHFPDKSEAPTALRQIYAAAARHELELAQAEYRLAPEREIRLVRYQVTVPVKGGYPRLRGFAADVLRELPYASLDDISIQREAVASANVEARLRFTLYFGSVDGGAL